MLTKFKTNTVLFVLMVIFALAAFMATWAYFNLKTDRDRLKENQNLLLHNGTVEIKQTNTGSSQASVPALTLRPSEFRRSGDTLLRTAKAAGIKTSRISEAATASTTTSVEFKTRIFQTIVHDTVRDTVARSLTTFLPSRQLQLSWNDPWVSLSGTITDSIFHGSITSVDTLDIIVHRVPKRFLFFRFGCKQVRMDIISRNPHTRLTYARYYQLMK
jgi:hypothetical protein